MRRGVVFGLCAALLLATTGSANQFDSKLLSVDELERAAKHNQELDAYLDRNGLPDVAESRVLTDRPPWDAHEVTLFYLGSRKEISFARAYVLGIPDVHIKRYERPLTDADIAALMDVADIGDGTEGDIENVAFVEDSEIAEGELVSASSVIVTSEPIDDADVLQRLAENPGDPVARAEAAAVRSTRAAEVVEAAAVTAERAALRAEKAFDRLAALVPTKAR